MEVQALCFVCHVFLCEILVCVMLKAPSKYNIDPCYMAVDQNSCVSKLKKVSNGISEDVDVLKLIVNCVEEISGNLFATWRLISIAQQIHDLKL